MKRHAEITLSQDLTQASVTDLRGRQSVRATFKLSEGCIDAITIVATQLGIKQKSLFDHLSEDTQTLQSIARRLRNQRLDRRDRKQKTYVISRRTLNCLDDIARRFDAPRDALVEYSVQRLLPLILRERRRHERRKEMLSRITRHFRRGEKLLAEIGRQLGKDDPVYRRLAAAMVAYAGAYEQIRAIVEKGRIIEDFDPASLGVQGESGDPTAAMENGPVGLDEKGLSADQPGGFTRG